MNFRDIQLKDSEWITPHLWQSGYYGCDYTFGNLFIWKDLYRQQVALCNDMVCIRSRKPDTGEYLYLYPAGSGDVRQAVEFMQQDAYELGVPFLLRGFSRKEAEALNELFPGRYQIESVRKQWDYLYEVKDLSTLSGKKYHGQRNHIARFLDNESIRYEPLSSDNKSACMEMCNIWYYEHKRNGNTGALFDRRVVENAFRYFEELGFTGGVLYVSDKVVGVTLGEPLNTETYVVHIEKAFSNIQGAYPFLNREYVKQEMQNYRYVNREEDDGLEGLRRAKESYHPIMLEKYVAKEVS